MQKRSTIARDISWLSFNSRVLQEANDIGVPIRERIKFLGIFSNNLDEFFRVRVATLKRMIEFGNNGKMHLEINPEKILEDILSNVLILQEEFEKTWKKIVLELKKENILIVNHKQINGYQKKFILNYFNEEVRGHIVPLMIETIKDFPALNDKSLYLACILSKKQTNNSNKKYALIAIPTRSLPRFIELPSESAKKIILLDDIIRFCLPYIFSFFNYSVFTAHAIKVTRDAEFDIDNEISTSLIQKIEKGIKSRKKGKPVRLVYDKEIPQYFLNYLIKKLNLTNKDNLIPGGKIHNFKDFMNFPASVFQQKKVRKKPFTHPLLQNSKSLSDVILKNDVLLHFPYHSFDSIIDLLREAAMDPGVRTIKITCYRLAENSKIINALVNAVRNGKKVIVVIELRARFDEEANLFWKQKLEEEGAKVFMGIPKIKVHTKICIIEKKINNKLINYGFISTGNLNEKTSLTYIDHCLLTSNKNIISDINNIFNFLEKPVGNFQLIRNCKTILVSPISMRKKIISLIDQEIEEARKKNKAIIIMKLNSLSDEEMIEKLYEAAKAGVEIKLIVRGFCCMYTENKKFKNQIQAISIIDEYLEHSRIFYFYNKGNEKVFISSADLMLRNLNHRIETACPILDEKIKNELLQFLKIQLSDSVKARILDNNQDNKRISGVKQKSVRSQVEIYNYLYQKLNKV